MTRLAKYLILWPLLVIAQAADVPNELLVVVGAQGEAEYGTTFADAARKWKAAADKGQAKITVIGAEVENSLSQIEHYLKDTPKESPTPLWLVLLGHGTANKREAHFNLMGQDLSAEQLKIWLEPMKRPLFIIHAGSCSGAFLPVLSGPNRIIITATKSGREFNATYFVTHLADTLLNPEADLDNDGMASVFEYFQFASSQTARYFEQETRIATEHALLDDNGDGKGTTIEALESNRKNPKPNAVVDGAYARRWSLLLSKEKEAFPVALREKRNDLERQIDELKQQRANLDEETYYQELEKLLLQIAKLYQAAKK